MASVTYKALGNSEEIEWWGLVFKDGEPVLTDNADLIAVAKGSPFFEVSEDAPAKRGPGRPPKAVEPTPEPDPAPVEPTPEEPKEAGA